MKVFLEESPTDTDFITMYQMWRGRRLFIATFCSDMLDEDLTEALLAAERDGYPLELELK